MPDCFFAKYGTGLLLDAQIPPEFGAGIMVMLVLFIGGWFSALLGVIFLLKIYIPLLVAQMDLLKLISKKIQVVEHELPWTQFVPLLNFFMAYIVAYHIEISLIAVSHESGTNLSHAAKKIGHWYCHTGMLMLVGISAAIFVSAHFLYASLFLLVLWVVLARKYLVRLDDIYAQMNGPEPPTVKADVM